MGIFAKGFPGLHHITEGTSGDLLNCMVSISHRASAVARQERSQGPNSRQIVNKRQSDVGICEFHLLHHTPYFVITMERVCRCMIFVLDINVRILFLRATKCGLLDYFLHVSLLFLLGSFESIVDNI